jgi:hypothetical protein
MSAPTTPMKSSSQDAHSRHLMKKMASVYGFGGNGKKIGVITHLDALNHHSVGDNDKSVNKPKASSTSNLN